jgi:transposase-like protein
LGLLRSKRAWGPQGPHSTRQKIDPKLERQIISLYSQGLSTRSISKQLEEIYGTEVSASFISTVTDQLLPEIAEWQNRPLSEVYPVVFLDALMYKVRADNKVSQKAVYTVLGINLDGEVDVLGLWLAETEGAKFWLSVLNDLKTRGVKDILLACVDGLKGFPEAIEVAFPRTQVQLCVVHQIRNSLKYLSSRDKKLFMLDLKKVYKAPNLKSAETALDELEKRWKGSNPAAVRGWRQNWQELSTYFDYSANIRKMIYTTNAVEGMHRQFRKATKTKGSFSNDDALMKLLYLSITNAKKSLRNKQGWPTILAELKITFEDRIP